SGSESPSEKPGILRSRSCTRCKRARPGGASRRCTGLRSEILLEQTVHRPPTPLKVWQELSLVIRPEIIEIEEPVAPAAVEQEVKQKTGQWSWGSPACSRPPRSALAGSLA